VQQKSEEKLSHANRLENLRKNRQWKIRELAEALDVSESAIYAVKAGKTGLGVLAEDRLRELEKASGISTVPQKQYEEVREGSYTADAEVWRRRAIALENQLANIRAALEQLLARTSISYSEPVSSAASDEDKAAVAAAEAAKPSRSGPKSQR
jgi:transcriptional regulator with XRE-family HTH domain